MLSSSVSGRLNFGFVRAAIAARSGADRLFAEQLQGKARL